MGGAKEVTAADVKALLADNTLRHFDPVAEAFSVFDISGTGYADVSVLAGEGPASSLLPAEVDAERNCAREAPVRHRRYVSVPARCVQTS